MAWGVVWLTLIAALLLWFAASPFDSLVRTALGAALFANAGLTALMLRALNRGSGLRSVQAMALSALVSAAIWTVPSLMLAGLGGAGAGLVSTFIAGGASLGAGPATLARLAGKGYVAAVIDFTIASVAVTGTLALVFAVALGLATAMA